MKTILFLDDWMLDSKRNIARRFCNPELLDADLTLEGTSAEDGEELVGQTSVYPNYLRDPETGLFKMWYQKSGALEVPGKNFNSILCYAESDDGIDWRKPDLGYWQQYGFDDSIRNAAGFDVYPTVTGKTTCDPFDPDPERRYKLTAIEIVGDIRDNDITGRLYTSPDGISWKIVPGAEWYTGRMGSDSNNQILHNPITGRYQITCRPSSLDRRIALVESEDLVHWTEPMVVLQPDALDGDLMQFYSISQHWYGDRFVGILQRQHVAETERNPVKWLGKIDDEVAYSYNGVYWIRSNRQPLIPRRPPGEFGSEQLYTSSMVETADGSLRFYTLGDIGEHCGAGPIEGTDYRSKVLVSSLRECGFRLPRAGRRARILRDAGADPAARGPADQLQGPERGGAGAGERRQEPALPGVLLRRLHRAAGGRDRRNAVSWKEGKGLEELAEKPVRLEFELFQAQVFAIHWDFRIRTATPSSRGSDPRALRIPGGKRGPRGRPCQAIGTPFRAAGRATPIGEPAAFSRAASPQAAATRRGGRAPLPGARGRTARSPGTCGRSASPLRRSAAAACRSHECSRRTRCSRRRSSRTSRSPCRSSSVVSPSR